MFRIKLIYTNFNIENISKLFHIQFYILERKEGVLYATNSIGELSK